jgi:carbamoyl-phosphate synthase large subunit
MTGTSSGPRVLVTGGAGVIARELLAVLSRRGADVLSVDRLPLAFAEPTGVRHWIADLALADLSPIADFRPDAIVHLAASFERSVETPDFWPQNWGDNVEATHRMLELACGLRTLRTFVFASSYLVYRTTQYLSAGPAPVGFALAEDADIAPRNLCGAAKLYGEAELRFTDEVLHGGFRTVSARIFRGYGRGSRDVISRWVRAALRDEQIEVYHPENRFDYVYSGDVAEGLARMALESEVTGAVNLATGIARSVNEVVEAIEAATGRRLNAVTVLTDEPYEGSRADIRILRDSLGWTPPTSLEDGISRIVEFERTNHV